MTICYAESHSWLPLALCYLETGIASCSKQAIQTGIDISQRGASPLCFMTYQGEMPSKRTWSCSCGQLWPCQEGRNQTSSFSFLELPSELRNKIYDLALFSDPQPQLDDSVFIAHTSWNEIARPAPTRSLHNLFSVCRQIRAETRLWYYSTNRFAFYRCDESHETSFRTWLASIGNDAAPVMTTLTMIDDLTTERNLRNFTVVNEIGGPLTTRYKCKATFSLDVVPPTVVTSVDRYPSGAYVVSDGKVIATALRSRSITSLAPTPRRLAIQARKVLAAAITSKLEGLFGNCHAGEYSVGDLGSVVGAFNASVHECFGDRRYWLRRKGTGETNSRE